MVLAEKVLVTEDRGYASEEQIRYRSKSQPLPQKRTWAVTGALLVTVIICNMVIQALVIQRDQQLTQLRKMVAVKEQEMIKLRLEMTQLDSFDRIRYIAQNELGMRDAGSRDYLLIKGSSSPVRDNSDDRSLIKGSSGQNGLWTKLSSWLGGIGRTMAKSP